MFLVVLFILLFFIEPLEKGGVLVETDHTHLFSEDIVTPVGSLTTPQIPEGAVVSCIMNLFAVGAYRI